MPFPQDSTLETDFTEAVEINDISICFVYDMEVYNKHIQEEFHYKGYINTTAEMF